MNDASAATLELLRGLNVAAAPRSVAAYVTAHPAYPSLAAIVDCLAELGVRASARRIAPESLASVPPPALLHVKDDAGKSAFWLVTDHDGGRFKCRLPDGRDVSLEGGELAARYLGIAVTAVAEAGAGERYAAVNELSDRLRSRLPHAAGAASGAALVTLAAAAMHVPAGMRSSALGLLLPGTLGFGLTLELALGEHVRVGGFLDKLCPAGKTFNCASVVGSRAGRVGGVIPLADLGAAFFLAQVVSSAVASLAGIFGAYVALFAMFSLVLAAVVVHSLVQQAFVLRRWCPLCLLLDVVLVTEIAVVARGSHLDLTALATLRAGDVVLLVGSALAAALAYAVVRPLVTPALVAPSLYAELESLRGLPEVTGAALARVAPVATDVPGKLVHGDAGAPMELLVVSHPFCAACADAHAAVGRLVEAFPDLVRSATVFSVAPEDRVAACAARALLGKELDIDGWYARLEDNVERFIGSDSDMGVEHAHTLPLQRAFAERQAVVGTPAIFLNGRRLPAGFALRHLRFYLRAEQRRMRSAEPAARESA